MEKYWYLENGSYGYVTAKDSYQAERKIKAINGGACYMFAHPPTCDCPSCAGRQG